MFFLLVVSTAAGPFALDWPRWRGPEGTGISAETGWDPQAVASGADVVWKAQVGSGYSAVSVAGGRLYTMGNNGREDTVYCLDAGSGKTVWTYSYPCGTGGYPGPRATPTVDGDRLYTLSREGHLHCLDARNGKLVWQRHLVRDFRAQPPTWGFASSAVVSGDLVVVNACMSGVALDKTTGREVWVSRAGRGSYAAAVIYDDAGTRYAAIFGARALYGVELETGRVSWSFDWYTDNDVHAADPIVVGNRIFISSGYDTGCALLELGGRKPKLLWQSRIMRNHFSSSLYLDGYVYGSDGQAGGGYLRCIDFDTGREMWSFRSGMVSLISAAGKLIVLQERGELFVLEATPRGIEEHSRARVLSNIVWTPPVLANGLLYCRNVAGELVCIDMRD